jgi:hypothetical protein
LLGRAFKAINEYQKAEEQLTNAILIDETQAALYTGEKNVFSLLSKVYIV